MIIDQGEAEVDNHIPQGDIFLLSPSQECNIYIIYNKDVFFFNST